MMGNKDDAFTRKFDVEEGIRGYRCEKKWH